MPCPAPKVGDAHFAVMVQISLSITRVAAQTISEPEIVKVWD